MTDEQLIAALGFLAAWLAGMCAALPSRRRRQVRMTGPRRAVAIAVSLWCFTVAVQFARR